MGPSLRNVTFTPIGKRQDDQISTPRLDLLYKKGDRSQPSNYRPITLLNHDVKLGPKILAYRLTRILPKLLHSDQNGFVPGRSIRHALVRFQDIHTLCRQNYHQAGAVLLDFAKAFDSVLWPALHLVLHHFGFGPQFRAWINTFYKDNLITIMVNGYASPFFQLRSGVRQGDPLSPLLFVLFLEPMLNYLRATTGHLGIPVAHDPTSHHLSAFADDVTGFLRNINDTPEFLMHVHHYAQSVGFRHSTEPVHDPSF